jgi:sec-independent protein translocase protein TatB
MFGIDSGELLVIALVALVVIGPKDLPRVMRTVGQWVGRARGMARHFRSGVDAMMRESELAEMEQKWKADNERIMREFPGHKGAEADWGKPLPALEHDAPAGAPEAAPAGKPVATRKPPAPRRAAAGKARPKPPPARAPVAPGGDDGQ